MSLEPIETSSNSSKVTEIFGTVDVTVLKRALEHVDIADYKFGRTRVTHASENIQGHAYMVGTFDKYPWAKTVTVHFITPRLDEVTKHTYNRDDLEWHRLRVNVIIARATAEEPELNPRTEVCKFCRNKVSCPTLKEQLLPLAKKYESNNFAIDLLRKYSPDTVTDPEVLGRMLEVAPVMEAWAKAAKAKALEVAVETGDEIPGFEVRFKNPATKIKDAQEAFDVLNEHFSAEEFMGVADVSIAKLAKALAAKLPRGEKGSARSIIELALMENDLIPKEDKVEKSPYLKKVS